MMFVEAPVVAGQGASEAMGASVTGGTLTGLAPVMVAPVPMGGEEVSLMLAQAAATPDGGVHIPAHCGCGGAAHNWRPHTPTHRPDDRAG